MPQSVKALDLGFKLSKALINIRRQVFLAGLPFRCEPVKLLLYRLTGGKVLRREVKRLRVDAAQAMGMRIVDEGFRPFPASVACSSVAMLSSFSMTSRSRRAASSKYPPRSSVNRSRRIVPPASA